VKVAVQVQGQLDCHAHIPGATSISLALFAIDQVIDIPALPHFSCFQPFENPSTQDEVAAGPSGDPEPSKSPEQLAGDPGLSSSGSDSSGGTR
jgi:hypothetical protein